MALLLDHPSMYSEMKSSLHWAKMAGAVMAMVARMNSLRMD
jgi:uncharacterized membrane protein YdcZ (DUF606 family)